MMVQPLFPQLVLASTSPYRKALLQRLNIPFSTVSPMVDETALENESPDALVMRLAELKARAGAQTHPDACIIGSDQVAVSQGTILGKPGNFDNAMQQLLSLSGRRVSFLTGMCLTNRDGNIFYSEVLPYYVHFRQINEPCIERYLHHEEPYNCAGSFKSEGLGISLFEKMEGEDPTALIGLPLIRLVTWLQNEGFQIP